MRTRELRPPADTTAHPRLEFSRPEFTGLRQRRFMTCVSKSERRVDHLWVDDEGSCQREGIHTHGPGNRIAEWSKWHLYQFRPHEGATPNAVAVRCPSTLEPEEWKRINADDPPGVMKDIKRTALEAALATRPRSRRSAANENGEEDWS